MRALVTNATRNAGLAVLRALARRSWQVAAADDRPVPRGLGSRFASGTYAMLPAEDSPPYAQALLALVDEVRPDVLLPIRGITTAVRERAALLRRTAALLPLRVAYDAVNDKSQLLDRCAEFGIAAPRRFEPDEARRWLAQQSDRRIVLKPSLDRGGGEGVEFIADAEQVLPAHARAVARFGDVLVSEYIPGPVGQLRAAHLLFDSETRLIGRFVLRKTRIWPREVGVTVGAVSVDEPALVESLLPLFRSLGWQGPADAEFKIDPRDGVPKLLEINPRFSGCIQFPIGCGVDLPHLYAQAAIGQRLPESRGTAYRCGVRYLDLSRWLPAALLDCVDAGDGIGGGLYAMLQELSGPRAPSVHEWSDPAPLLAKLLGAGQRPGGLRRA